MPNHFTVPGLADANAKKVIDALDERLVGLADLALTLKHIHWNVVGPNFIGVHEMLDTHVDGVRAMVDQVAERIAMLGGVPVGTPGALVKRRDWDDYSIGRATVPEHLAALDLVYVGVIEDMRKVIDKIEELDPITHDMLIGHTGELEQYQWFVRAHLEDREGRLAHEGATTEKQATKAVRAAS